MPNLQHLLDDLKRLGVKPDEVIMPGQLYDDLYDQAQDNIEDDSEKE